MQLKISELSETLFITLFARAADALKADSILNDQRALEISQKLKHEAHDFDAEILTRLKVGKFDSSLSLLLSLRSKFFDRECNEFVKENEKSCVVNFGAGLDTRCYRLRYKPVRYCCVDFEEIIKLREYFGLIGKNVENIAGSVFDEKILEKIYKPGYNYLFLAEGLFMYYTNEEVKKLLEMLAVKFPGSEIVFEVYSSKWETGWRKNRAEKKKNKIGMGKNIEYKSGIPSGDYYEDKSAGIHFLGDWSYSDQSSQIPFMLKLSGWHTYFREVQWVVKYRLGEHIA